MIEIWFDGIVNPVNPGGHGGFGMLVKRDGETIHREAQYVGCWPSLSNNCTEFAGAIAALRYLLREKITEATVYGDADMIVKQLNGRWQAKGGAYFPYYAEAIILRRQLPDVKMIWIPREMNTEADELSWEAISRQPLIVSFELDKTLDTSAIQPSKKAKRQSPRPVEEGVNDDETWQLFCQKTAEG